MAAQLFNSYTLVLEYPGPTARYPATVPSVDIVGMRAHHALTRRQPAAMALASAPSGLFIDGAFVAPLAGGSLDAINPATAERLAQCKAAIYIAF